MIVTRKSTRGSLPNTGRKESKNGESEKRSGVKPWINLPAKLHRCASREREVGIDRMADAIDRFSSWTHRPLGLGHDVYWLISWLWRVAEWMLWRDIPPRRLWLWISVAFY